MAKKECFRKHSKKKVEERRCSECTDVADCMVYSIDMSGKTVTSENTPVRKGCFGNYQAVISSPRKCGVCMDIEECIYETEIRNALDVMRLNDEPSCKKGCFRDFRADIQRERKCARCVDFDECTWPSDMQKEELVGESRAAKLDQGKRQYSLIIPGMMEIMLPKMDKDSDGYWHPIYANPSSHIIEIRYTGTVNEQITINSDNINTAHFTYTLVDPTIPDDEPVEPEGQKPTSSTDTSPNWRNKGKTCMNKTESSFCG